MMTEVFIGSMAFSMGLLAFTGGVWLTLTTNGKLVGMIITVLAIFSLVFTSYNVARIVFMQNAMKQMMSMQMSAGAMKHHDKKMKKEAANKAATEATKSE